MQQEIYFSLAGEYKTDKRAVRLSYVCKIWRQGEGAIDPDICFPFEREFLLITAFDVTKELAKLFPNDAIVNAGPQELVLKRPERYRAKTVLLSLLLVLILFFGGAVGIMSFFEDVSMDKLHSSVHQFFTGEQVNAALWVSLPFAVGVAAGFIVVLQIFKRRKYPPGVLDIDMDEYETQVDDYIAKRE